MQHLSGSRFTNNKIILGDFNPHCRWLGYDKWTDEDNIAGFDNNLDVVCLQSLSTPTTHTHNKSGTRTRPDLTFVSSQLVKFVSVSVLGDVGSDHLPVVTTINATVPKVERPVRFKWNFNTADWPKFQRKLYLALSSLDRDLNMSTGPVANLVAGVTEAFDRAGKSAVQVCKASKPWSKGTLGGEGKRLARVRTELRRQFEKDPTPSNRSNWKKADADCMKACLAADRLRLEKIAQRISMDDPSYIHKC